MIIRSPYDARRALRWRPFSDHPATRAAVKLFVDEPTPLSLQEANHALSYQLAIPDREALAAWVRSAPVPRRKR